MPLQFLKIGWQVHFHAMEWHQNELAIQFSKIGVARIKLILILKIDFEKVYDKVKWPFLLQTLRMKGFSPKWCSWVQSFISGGSVAVNVNNEIGHYFQTRKGLRQGDPLSPLLF